MKTKRILKEEKTLINALFYQYLTEKKIYFINYVSDSDINTMSHDFQLKIKNENFNLNGWYNSQLKTINTDLEKYKLCICTLICVDQFFLPMNRKVSFDFYKDMVMCYGTKAWRETTITFESCPFQNIRGVILNDNEISKFKHILGNNNFQEYDFFGDTMILAASHADATLDFKPTRDLNFKNKGLNVYQNENIKEAIEKSIAYAQKKSSSILIFPELIMNENAMQQLISYLNTNCGKSSSLKLVVAGSMYENCNPPFTNTTHVYYNNDGVWGELTSYDKMIPFSVTAGKLSTADINTSIEDIDVETDVTIIPTKDGIIGVAICRDAMDLLDSHNPIHKYTDFVDLLLIISYNNGDSNMFVGAAECLARWHNCGTLYTNSIKEAYPSGGGIDDKLEISFAIYPYKNSRSSTSLSGEITYASAPFNSELEKSEYPLKIVSSKGVKYSTFNKEEIDNQCKIYTMKTKDESVKAALVLDTSFSMSYYNYVDVTVVDSKAFVSSFLKNDSIAISNYSTNAETPFPLRKIDNTRVIDKAINCIKSLSFTGGSTAIGLGLEEGMKQLEGVVGNRGLVLLSDGYQNSGKDPLSLPKAPYPVYACAMGPQSNQTLLKNIAENSTGGSFYYCPKVYDMSLIYNDIKGLEPNTFVVVNDLKEVQPQNYEILTATISKNNELAQIVVTWTNLELQYTSGNPDADHISITLVRPDNVTLQVKPTFVDKGYATFNIDKPLEGDWKVQIMQGSTNVSSHVSVGVFESPYDKAIELIASTNSNYKLGNKVGLHIELKHGNEPIKNAHITAELIKPSISIKKAIKLYANSILDMKSDNESEIETLLKLNHKNGGEILKHEKSIHLVKPFDELTNTFVKEFENITEEGGYYIRVIAKGISSVDNSRFERTRILGFVMTE